MKFHLTSLLLLFTSVLSAQKQGMPLIDSLIGTLAKQKPDTNHVKILNRISITLSSYDGVKGAEYGEKGLKLAEKLGWEKGIAVAYNSIGANYMMRGENPKALEYFAKAQKINEAAKNNQLLAQNFGNMALVYDQMSKYPKALEYLFKALGIFETLHDKLGIATQYGNIGNIYSSMGNVAKTIYYDSLALIKYKELNDQEGMAIQYGNLGNAYSELGNQLHAIEYDEKALKIYESLENPEGVARNTSNIGVCYQMMNDYLHALDYQFRALQLYRNQNYIDGIANALGNIGLYYYHIYNNKDYLVKGKYMPVSTGQSLIWSKKYLEQSVDTFRLTNNLNMQSYFLGRLSATKEALGDKEGALRDFKESTKLKDSIFSLESKVKIEGLITDREVELKNKQIVIDTLEVEKKRQREIFLVGGILLLLVIVFIIFMYFRREKKVNVELAVEKEKSDTLLLNILPEQIAAELKETGVSHAKLFTDVTVLFIDFVGFTTISENMSPQELVAELDHCFSEFDNITSAMGLEKIKTVGDSYIVAGGLPEEQHNHAHLVVKQGIAMRDFMLEYKAKREAESKVFFDFRIGINSGSVVAGIVGIKKFAYDIWGDTVNTAARMEQNSEPGRINISGSTYTLIKDDFNCEYRGKIEAKNKGAIDMYFVN